VLTGKPLPEGLFLSAGFPSPVRTFDEELDRVRANTELVVEQIHTEFADGVPAEYEPWLRRPADAMGAYLAALRRYYEDVVVELYPKLTDRLAREADVYRRLVAEEGMAFLSRMHAKVRPWEGGLRYVEPHLSGRFEIAPTRIVLTPMVSAPQTVTANVTSYGDAGVLQFCFASPNLAISADRPRRRRADPLATLLGFTRAMVVRELAFGRSTTDLANRLRLSPAAVSHHLRILVESDTATAYRAGQRVYYRLTDRGQALLRLYGDPA
jgi:DNA-binding transcriptional ArsR family regulator